MSERGGKTVNADVVQAALSNILDGLMDRGMMPAVRLSITKQRVIRLMNQVDSVAADDRRKAALDDIRAEQMDYTIPYDEVLSNIGTILSRVLEDQTTNVENGSQP